LRFSLDENYIQPPRELDANKSINLTNLDGQEPLLQKDLKPIELD
jgi:hypothetical protein